MAGDNFVAQYVASEQMTSDGAAAAAAPTDDEGDEGDEEEEDEEDQDDVWLGGRAGLEQQVGQQVCLSLAPATCLPSSLAMRRSRPNCRRPIDSTSSSEPPPEPAAPLADRPRAADEFNLIKLSSFIMFERSNWPPLPCSPVARTITGRLNSFVQLPEYPSGRSGATVLGPRGASRPRGGH